MTVQQRHRRLLWLKLVHTAVWAVLASATLVVPLAVMIGNPRLAFWPSLMVWVEVAVLASNGLRCPFRDVAERYTDDRSHNFDIFLPAWLARHNILIFSIPFFSGQAALMYGWLAG